MARDFVFLKNIKFNLLKTLFFDNLENNFIFFKKFTKFFLLNVKFIKLKKINFNKKCINILYF
jgi:hypothetical protein